MFDVADGVGGGEPVLAPDGGPEADHRHGDGALGLGHGAAYLIDRRGLGRRFPVSTVCWAETI